MAMHVFDAPIFAASWPIDDESLQTITGQARWSYGPYGNRVSFPGASTLDLLPAICRFQKYKIVFDDTLPSDTFEVCRWLQVPLKGKNVTLTFYNKSDWRSPEETVLKVAACRYLRCNTIEIRGYCEEVTREATACITSNEVVQDSLKKWCRLRNVIYNSDLRLTCYYLGGFESAHHDEVRELSIWVHMYKPVNEVEIKMRMLAEEFREWSENDAAEQLSRVGKEAAAGVAKIRERIKKAVEDNATERLLMVREEAVLGVASIRARVREANEDNELRRKMVDKAIKGLGLGLSETSSEH